jgi:hypothetical protein
VPSTAYRQWVYRLWDRLQLRTGHPVHYMAHNRIACYCPSCGVGTLSLTFADADPPLVMVSSQAYPGHCSEGCTEAEVMEALFS